MAIRIAINGYGRIGRNVLRALYEEKKQAEIKIIAINDLGDVNVNTHLTRYDSTHGRYQGKIYVENDQLHINGDTIQFYSLREPSQLPWKDLDIDVVLECTGFFTKREQAIGHLHAGAKKVLISAPGKEADNTIVYGVNHHTLKASHEIVSNASCTTNCLAPLVKPLNDALGIKHGLMTTIHSYTNDQKLLDATHSDLRRARSATESLIPTKTGAAAAVGLVLPELAGKLDGFAVRVPTTNVSLVDLTFHTMKETTIDEVSQILRAASEGALKGILGINEEPLVSIDFNHTSYSSIYDATQTRVLGNFVKVLAWYDNEWGFSCRMLDTTKAMMDAE